MNIYLATNNQDKKREVAEIFLGHEIITPRDAGIEFAPDENGRTFYENSIIKAKALYDMVHEPVIADDSGICVDALGGAPGIYSARYAGKNAPRGLPDGTKIAQSEQNALLIAQLNDALAKGETDTSGFANGERSCHYTCAMVLYMGHDRIFVAQETMEGKLVDSIEDARGDGGFGYDPLVILPSGKTVAQLSDAEKNEISHRGKACRAIFRLINSPTHSRAKHKNIKFLREQ